MLSGHIGCKRWLIKLSRSGEELGPSYPNFSAFYSCICSLLWKGSQLKSAAGVTCDLDSVWLEPVSILRWFRPRLGLCCPSRHSVRCGFDFHLAAAWLPPRPLMPERQLTIRQQSSSLFFSQTLLLHALSTPARNQGCFGKLHIRAPLCLDMEPHQVNMIYLLSG